MSISAYAIMIERFIAVYISKVNTRKKRKNNINLHDNEKERERKQRFRER